MWYDGGLGKLSFLAALFMFDGAVGEPAGPCRAENGNSLGDGLAQYVAAN